MNSKKFNEKKNICCNLIKSARLEKNMSRAALSKKLELYGVYLHVNEIYRIEKNTVLLKDFELAAIADILGIDLNIIKDLLNM